ncbi:MAG TPA: hypothetical protein VFV87_15945, partial [Pirellulaceae bacterium]|nr:hypothetical protein [Pirellulaceae bacterium]
MPIALFSAFVAFAWLETTLAEEDAGTASAWGRVIEDDRAIKIETEQLEAVVPKKNPKQWMTGIEKQSFLDKATGYRELGDG